MDRAEERLETRLTLRNIHISEAISEKWRHRRQCTKAWRKLQGSYLLTVGFIETQLAIYVHEAKDK